MEAILNSVNAGSYTAEQCSCFGHTKKSIIMISCKPHLINTLVKESQAGVFIAYKRALLYEPTEHLSLDHERVKPLMGAVAALQEAYKKKWCKHKHDMWALTGDYKTRRALIKQFLNVYKGHRADFSVDRKWMLWYYKLFSAALLA